MSRGFILERYYTIDPSTGCWNWKLKNKLRGYGRMTYNKKPLASHRFFYEQLVGKIPQGLTIDHLCKNRGCVNPRHLEAVSLKENIRRSSKKLNIEKVKDIKQRYFNSDMTQVDLSEMFNVNQSLISRIVTGRYWSV